MDWVEWLTHWLDRYEALAGLLIYTIALAESLALVGVILPGVALLFAVGVLMGSGALPVTTSLLCCFAGAVSGDGISFLLGAHFKGSLKHWRLFRRHPEWLINARHFFHRHGIASIVIGRFVGPLRPILPLIAGSLGMAPRRFFTINVLTALVWAPVYLLPGFLVGASATSDPALARPLMIMLGGCAALLWLWWWCFKRWPTTGSRVLSTVGLVTLLLGAGELFHRQLPPDALLELWELIWLRLQS